MYNCDKNCNKLCPRLVISTSVTVVTVDGTDTLVIDIPASTYRNHCKYCLIVAQSIPTTATVSMPVAVSIGGDTTTVYPLVCSKTCLQAVACQVSTRTKYCTVVQTNTVSGVFRVLTGLGSYCPEVLDSLPVAPATAAAAATVLTLDAPGKATKTITTTTKEVISRE